MASSCIPRLVVVVFVVVGLARAVRGAQSIRVKALEPWAANTHPTDVAKRHGEALAAGRHHGRMELPFASGVWNVQRGGL